MAKVSTFDELSLDTLQDIYDAEHQITEALPQMREAATTPELKDAFSLHLAQTQDQIARLEQVFESLGEEAKRKTCVATKGLIAETNEYIKEVERGPLLDAALIAGAQKVEHYEMAAYGTARTYAMQMGNQDIASLLETTLNEEEQTDKILTGIAESVVNQRAATQ